MYHMPYLTFGIHLVCKWGLRSAIDMMRDVWISFIIEREQPKSPAEVPIGLLNHKREEYTDKKGESTDLGGVLSFLPICS